VLKLKVGLVLCAAGAIALRGPLGDANEMRRVPGARWMPDQRLAKLFSLGHRSTCADAIWLNAIGNLSRDFGDQTRKRRWLDTVFDTITRLEPTFSNVYSWGATYLGMLSNDKESAIDLLKKGVANNPDDVKLQIELAMAHFEYKKDRAATLAVLAKVVKHPKCDAITMGFYDSLLVDDRADYAALATMAPWLDSANVDVKEEAELYLERTKKLIAFRAWNEFKDKHGRDAKTKDELRDKSLMAPEVFEPVLGSFEIDGDKLRFPRLDELDRKHALRTMSSWSRQYRIEHGHLPDVPELMRNPWTGGRNIAPPTGQHYVIDDAGVRLEND
jgi:hypothetical protein